jgi:hypothetical protein
MNSPTSDSTSTASAFYDSISMSTVSTHSASASRKDSSTAAEAVIAAAAFGAVAAHVISHQQHGWTARCAFGSNNTVSGGYFSKAHNIDGGHGTDCCGRF